MKYSLAIVLVLVCLAAAPALGWDFTPGPDYWPLDWANMYIYINGSGRAIEVVTNPWGTAGFRQDSICMSDAGWEWTKHDMFQIDASGDVTLASVSYEDRSGVAYSWEYSPPLKFIDDPLFVGKSWTSSGTAVGTTTESPTSVFWSVPRQL
ncbi:MAG: hypothetical protein IPG61_07790 [bacterium]|nr:hypothetical protein [bacterium]